MFCLCPLHGKEIRNNISLRRKKCFQCWNKTGDRIISEVLKFSNVIDVASSPSGSITSFKQNYWGVRNTTKWSLAAKRATSVIPGHLTRVKLHTVGNLTLNEARPVGHLTFVPKRVSAVGNKRISNSLIQQVSRVHGSLVLSIPRGFFCGCRFI